MRWQQGCYLWCLWCTVQKKVEQNYEFTQRKRDRKVSISHPKPTMYLPKMMPWGLLAVLITFNLAFCLFCQDTLRLVVICRLHDVPKLSFVQPCFPCPTSTRCILQVFNWVCISLWCLLSPEDMALICSFSPVLLGICSAQWDNRRIKMD